MQSHESAGAVSEGARAVRVLYVEDDEENRAIVAAILARAGFEVASVATAREAILAAGRRAFDVALVDLGLPDLDGWEVARRVRERSPGTAIVVLSGWGDGARAERRRGPADAVLTKPAPPRDLVGRILHVARRRREAPP